MTTFRPNPSELRAWTAENRRAGRARPALTNPKPTEQTSRDCPGCGFPTRAKSGVCVPCRRESR